MLPVCVPTPPFTVVAPLFVIAPLPVNTPNSDAIGIAGACAKIFPAMHNISAAHRIIVVVFVILVSISR
jgi:hypothetical protein